MKAIVDYTKEEHVAMAAKRDALYKAINGELRENLITFNKSYGYAHYTFHGFYTKRLVEMLGREPDEDEIIILVDGGFYHFGATCFISRDGTGAISGRVNID